MRYKTTKFMNNMMRKDNISLCRMLPYRASSGLRWKIYVYIDIEAGCFCQATNISSLVRFTSWALIIMPNFQKRMSFILNHRFNNNAPPVGNNSSPFSLHLSTTWCRTLSLMPALMKVFCITEYSCVFVYFHVKKMS